MLQTLLYASCSLILYLLPSLYNKKLSTLPNTFSHYTATHTLNLSCSLEQKTSHDSERFFMLHFLSYSLSIILSLAENFQMLFQTTFSLIIFSYYFLLDKKLPPIPIASLPFIFSCTPYLLFSQQKTSHNCGRFFRLHFLLYILFIYHSLFNRKLTTFSSHASFSLILFLFFLPFFTF